MSKNAIFVVLLGLVSSPFTPHVASAGIPLPDAVLYGRVFLDGVAATAQDDVTVIARVDGVPDPVGRFRVGESSVVGRYVLRIRLESLADGSEQSDNAARVGQTANIFVKQGDEPEEQVGDLPLTAIGIMQRLDPSIQCGSTGPTIVHANAGATATAPCSGYIDPRRESTNGVDLNQGLSQITLVFDKEVRDREGTDLTAAAFTVRNTGAAVPPNVQSISASLIEDKHVVTVTLDRIITLQEWTTVEADVEDFCGNPIQSFGAGSAGDLGPESDEPDRVDIAFLPANVNQGDDVDPFDVLAFRQFTTNGTFPDPACSNDPLDYFDIDRSGGVDPFDVLALRRIIQGVSPATRAWSGEELNNPRP